MGYLPEGEAKRRHDERVKAKLDKLKEQRRRARIAKGLPAVSTPEWRKEQMRLYMQNRRAKEREENKDALLAKKKEKEAKKAATAARLLAKLNADRREKRRFARESGKPDFRTKEYRPQPVPKDKPVKPEKLRKIRAVKKTKEEKTMAIRKIDITACVPLKLDAKTTIYVKPGSDTKAIIQRFQNRNN
ncbi:hypothetical protein [Pedobacter nyackensis]|uniref:Uncharacterized protein n=1 Tax=Pedobacter nyackensis TaxID=475255 RepID=A0A1W1ZVW0_9SPHI|nr:hypothetical protein [Pedobacter nyackensis]SMC52560.1 hypothetical protein SAMN04488101_10194 [Pedobacter nyackensis]